MNKRDLQFIISHIDAVGASINGRLDGIDGRLDGIDRQLTAVIEALTAHTGDRGIHGEPS